MDAIEAGQSACLGLKKIKKNQVRKVWNKLKLERRSEGGSLSHCTKAFRLAYISVERARKYGENKKVSRIEKLLNGLTVSATCPGRAFPTQLHILLILGSRR